MSPFQFSTRGITRLLAVSLFALLAVSQASAFIVSNPNFDPWLTTASGSRTGNGQPVTLTWGFVADGVSTPDGSGGPNVASNLISVLDTAFGGTPLGASPTDLTRRPWFDFFQQSVDRWEELSGINYVYEPNDSGQTLGSASGISGVRADVRIGGRSVDGSNGTLAFNYLPNNGDMVIDTDDINYFSNATNNHVRFRNTIMHELGHGLGLEHVVSNTDGLLLEPAINPTFDGPQLDEVRAAHYYFGDINEKSFNGLGNGTIARATSLGTISHGSSRSVGTDANVPSQFISPNTTDFVSISNLEDTDYFSFNITEPGLLDAVLTPLGGIFNQGEEGSTPATFNANARSNLQFDVLNSSGIPLLSTVNSAGLGGIESLNNFSLEQAGQYYIRVQGGLEDTIQLYQLDLSVSNEVFLEADFNRDGFVNAADLTIWQSAVGTNALGDATGDNITNGADFIVWQQQFGTFPAPPISGVASVPEPCAALLLLLGMLGLSVVKRHS